MPSSSPSPCKGRLAPELIGSETDGKGILLTIVMPTWGTWVRRSSESSS
jgi:hypothetical protein